MHRRIRPCRHPGELRGHRRTARLVDPDREQRSVPRAARRAPGHRVRDLSRRGAEDGGPGRRRDRQYQLVRVPRRLRRHRVSGGEGRGERADAGDRRRVEGARGAGQRDLPGRQNPAVHRGGLRTPHRRAEPARPARRRQHGRGAGRRGPRLRRAAVRLPGQRPRRGGDRPDLRRGEGVSSASSPGPHPACWPTGTTTIAHPGRCRNWAGFSPSSASRHKRPSK
ncbi:hypothetical protein C1Y40_05759 [Mycobacterium talmoniae]|uniref:Uncharacterized protein n=1 Tax=Mycobacterium talmoniae TaxID=1858794 RepID=A0A2S8BBQ5_9MYCO|nr:hypothetical protein C1Y40_05759 [Mycobacterium talmoniae]